MASYVGEVYMGCDETVCESLECYPRDHLRARSLRPRQFARTTCEIQFDLSIIVLLDNLSLHLYLCWQSYSLDGSFHAFIYVVIPRVESRHLGR